MIPDDTTGISCSYNARGPFGLTIAFCRTLPLVAMMETGLFFSADAELTGSALTLLLWGWDDDDDDEEEDVWGAGRVAALCCR